MGIFYGGVIYGIRITDCSSGAILYETAVDIGAQLDKPTIRKILLDDSRRKCDRTYSIYTYFTSTHYDSSVASKGHMWRPATRAELVDYAAAPPAAPTSKALQNTS